MIWWWTPRALVSRRVLWCYGGDMVLYLPLLWSSLFGWGSLANGHSPLITRLEGGPCDSYASSMHAYFFALASASYASLMHTYFFALASILEKSIDALYSIKKREGHLYSLLLIAIIEERAPLYPYGPSYVLPKWLCWIGSYMIWGILAPLV